MGDEGWRGGGVGQRDGKLGCMGGVGQRVREGELKSSIAGDRSRIGVHGVCEGGKRCFNTSKARSVCPSSSGEATFTADAGAGISSMSEYWSELGADESSDDEGEE